MAHSYHAFARIEYLVTDDNEDEAIRTDLRALLAEHTVNSRNILDTLEREPLKRGEVADEINRRRADFLHINIDTARKAVEGDQKSIDLIIELDEYQKALWQFLPRLENKPRITQPTRS